MTTDYRIDWPLPDSYLIELGRLSALWASLESFLNVLIGKLAGFNEIADTTLFILVTHSSFPQRLDMLGALCEKLKDEHPHLSNHKDVIAKLRSAQSNRNKYAHNGVTFDSETNQYVLSQGSARGKVKFSVEAVTVDDIHKVSKEIHEAQLSLYELVLKRQITPVWNREPNT